MVTRNLFLTHGEEIQVVFYQGWMGGGLSCTDSVEVEWCGRREGGRDALREERDQFYLALNILKSRGRSCFSLVFHLKDVKM